MKNNEKTISSAEKDMPHRIEVELFNGYKLVAEQNSDPLYSKEIFVGIEDKNGVWIQGLATVRNSYRYEGHEVRWIDGMFDVLIFGKENDEDFTEDFTILLCSEEQENN